MAGTVNKQNILVGAASLYLGPSGLARPAHAAGTSYKTTLDGDANWTNVGFTQEGLEVSYEPDYGDVEVDQLLDSAVIFKQSMRVSLNTTLAEATLFNLMISWGQALTTLSSGASSATLDIEGGALGEAPVERGFISVGNGNQARGTNAAYSERTYHAYRVLSVDTSAHAQRRNENTGIPVSFRALPADTGKYGIVHDRARTW